MDSGKFFAGSSMILLLIFIIIYVYIYNLYLSCFFYLSFFYIYNNSINTIKNVEEMTPAATNSRSHRAVVDQGKETPFVSLFSPFLERIIDEKRSHHKTKSVEKPSNLVGHSNLIRDGSVVVVQSGFVGPTLIRDGNRQGEDKRLTSVMESKRKSQKVDLTRKPDKNVVNIHRMIPHVVSASLSEYVQPTSISKGGKPIESQKHKGHEKPLSSVVASRRKSEHIGLVRKQDKQVVRTQRTGVVPAQGHIPVVRSGFEWPTLLQKDSKSIGSEKLQGQEKRLSSVVESRRKSEHIGLVRKQDKQVVHTQRTITGVVPAQGHKPVVRSGFERPTLIQKDSKTIGSEKLQGSEKLLSSIVESKTKSGNIDSSRKIDIKVVGTRKDLVDERPLQSVSKQNVKAVPQLPPYKGRKINSTSELKARWKF